MEIKELNESNLKEFKALIKIFNQVFENEDASADDSHLSNLLANKSFKAFGILVNEIVIGGLTVLVWI